MTPKNLVASIGARLLQLSRERHEDFELTLRRYALERFLYRLSQSPHVKRFVLKGAMLHSIWSGRAYRPTRDLDFLGYGASDPESIAQAIRDICGTQAGDDGLEFDLDRLRVSRIREEEAYGGMRATLLARLGRTRIPVQIDVGFGDVVVPGAKLIQYPAMLEMPAPCIHAYSEESVVAEKLQTMVVRGMGNSRMRDLYDLWMIARTQSFDGETLAEAIRQTFERRKSPLPESDPIALTTEFAKDPDKTIQWEAFRQRIGAESAGAELAVVIDHLRGFLLEPVAVLTKGDAFAKSWKAGGPWI